MSHSEDADDSAQRHLARLFLGGGLIGALALAAVAVVRPESSGLLTMLVFPVAMVLVAARLGVSDAGARRMQARFGSEPASGKSGGLAPILAVAFCLAGALWVCRDAVFAYAAMPPSPQRTIRIAVGALLIVSMAYGAWNALRSVRGPRPAATPGRRAGIYLSFAALSLFLSFAPLIAAFMLAPDQFH